MVVVESVDVLLDFLSIILSWPVVIFLVIFIFREEIRNLVKDMEIKKIETPIAGIELKSKIVDTDIGKMELSGVTVNSSNVGLAVIEGIQETFIGENFLISWPSKVWGNSEEGKALVQKLLSSPTQKCPIVIIRNEQIDDFTPNVNVIVEFVGNLSISQYADITIKQMKQIGGTVFGSPQIYEDINVAFIDFSNDKLQKRPFRQLQKIVIASGRAYIVTASIAQNTITTGQANIKELVDIVNSFRLMI